MKIRDLLAEIYSLVQEEQGHPLWILEEYILAKAIALDRKKTLNEFEKKIREQGEQKANRESLEPFRVLLENRWQRIRGTNLSYFYTSRHPLTILCEKLADTLAGSGFFSQTKFSLLMSTIRSFNEVTLLDLSDYASELTLKQITLSDAETDLIHVEACLTDSSEDNVLKHTHVLSERQAKLLSAREKERVVRHSRQATEYYEALKELYEIKNNGESIGSAVKRLVTGLMKSGVEGGHGGTELVAGTSSVRTIKTFYEFTKLLTTEERDSLFACALTSYPHRSFKFFWFRLLSQVAGVVEIPDTELTEIRIYLSSEASELLVSVPCVQVMAGQFDRLLSEHNELYNQYPVNHEETDRMAIETCESLAGDTRSGLIEDQKREDYEIRPGYGTDGNHRLINQVFDALTAPELLELLDDMGYTHCEQCITEIISPEKLRQIIENTSLLKQIFLKIEVSLQTRLLTILGPAFFREKIKTVDDICTMVEILPPASFDKFFGNMVGQEQCKRILNGVDISLRFSGLRGTEYRALTRALGIRSNIMDATFFSNKRGHKRGHDLEEKELSRSIRTRSISSR